MAGVPTAHRGKCLGVDSQHTTFGNIQRDSDGDIFIGAGRKHIIVCLPKGEGAVSLSPIDAKDGLVQIVPITVTLADDDMFHVIWGGGNHKVDNPVFVQVTDGMGLLPSRRYDFIYDFSSLPQSLLCIGEKAKG